MSIPDLSGWITRLQGLHLFDEVGGFLELAAAMQRGEATGPSAFVVYDSDKADANATLGGALVQQVTGTVAVLFLVPNYPEYGSGGETDLRTLRNAVLGSLLNWVPAGVNQVVQYAGGDRRSDVDAGLLVWQDNYITGWRLCQPTRQA